MRPVDICGLLGLLLVALDVAVFKTNQHFLPLWAKWLLGSLLWYLGFALMLGWAGLRLFRTYVALQSDDEAPAAGTKKHNMAVSNFLEHDYEDVIFHGKRA
jgi:hypothetical protein